MRLNEHLLADDFGTDVDIHLVHLSSHASVTDTDTHFTVVRTYRRHTVVGGYIGRFGYYQSPVKDAWIIVALDLGKAVAVESSDFSAKILCSELDKVLHRTSEECDFTLPTFQELLLDQIRSYVEAHRQYSKVVSSLMEAQTVWDEPL